jgi:hypothetical protein
MPGMLPALLKTDDGRGALAASIEVACDTLLLRQTIHMGVHE